MGRAYEAMGDKETAQQAYVAGGAHQTELLWAFGGGKGWDCHDPADLAGTENVSGLAAKAVPGPRPACMKRRALLLAAGELSLAERFWVHLSETQDRTALGHRWDRWRLIWGSRMWP